MSDLHVALTGFDPARRARLREMLREASFKSQIDFKKSTAEVIGALEIAAPIDIVIVPVGKKGSVVGFLTKLAEYPAMSRPLVVVSLRGSDHDSVLVSELYCAGVSGFLSEPYSSDTLEEVLKTAWERKEKTDLNPTERDTQVAFFLLSNSMRLLDEIARERKGGLKARGRSGKKLSEVGQAYGNTVGKLGIETLVDRMIERFEAAVPFESAEKKVVKAIDLKPVTHPGHYIRGLLDKRSISREKVLEMMRVDPAEFDAVLEGKADLTEALTAELTRVIGGAPAYWIRLQQAYTEYREALEEVEREKVK